MQKLINKLDDKLIKTYVAFKYSKALKLGACALCLSLLIVPESTFADTGVNGTAGLDGMVKEAESIFNNKLMKMAITASGLGSIGYSIFGGFRIAPLLTGIGIIAFQILYSSYIKGAFA